MPEETNQQIQICKMHFCFHEPNCRSASGSRKHFFISYTNFQLLHCYNCTLQLVFYCVCFIYPHLSLFAKCLRRRNCKLQRHHPRGRQFLGLRHIWEIIIKFHCHLLYIYATHFHRVLPASPPPPHTLTHPPTLVDQKSQS